MMNGKILIKAEGGNKRCPSCSTWFTCGANPLLSLVLENRIESWLGDRTDAFCLEARALAIFMNFTH